MPDAANKRPIIVIKKKGGHGGHHGGAWKVAYADFVTAMMSLFIVLWLLNSTPQVKKSVAGYFNDPKGSGTSSGSSAAGTNESVSIDKTNVEKLKEEIQKAILNQPDLKKLNKQVEMTIMGEGLKIELIEDKGGTFFDSGSAKLSESGVALMAMLAGQLKVLPNSISIEGHTDAQPYASENGYSNWELSTDRANSARRLLQEDGVGEKQVSQVRGFADQQLRVPANPLDPSNRRISLIVSWEMAPEAPAKPTEGKEGAAKEDAPKEGAAKEAKPAESAEGKAAAADVPKNPAKDKPSAGVTADGKPLPATEAAPAAKTVEAKPAAPVKLSLMDRIKAMLPGKKTKPADAKPAEAAKPEVSAKTEGEPRPAAEAKPSSEGSAPAEGGKPVAPADASPATAAPATAPAKTGMAGIMDKLKAMMPGKKK
jgi:chemotaxis protein MotB